MASCPTCAAELERQTAFCPSCGSALADLDDARTVLTTEQTPPSPRPKPARTPVTPSGFSPPSSAAWLHARSTADGGFAPGAIVGGRFRVIGLLGRGGMGEVYRADDLLLEQPVALKFLPRDLATDPERLARFYAEVRIARGVSHPNVCRVYDIGEIDDQPYLSMEHVDGDDLASLLRRIGRLPEDKALDVARQLCAGLAAAHERGVLHRDLKPANILIDSNGKVRITDFGLAVLAERVGTNERRAGTPAYMAPEQLTRNEVSVRSDIYSLGLVLYELFTGKRAFQADSVLEVERLQRQTMPPSPSTILTDLDPTIERAILRCLDKDPNERPESALAVAASLPGGDPLAAALAAGEIPSPELVAAAGGVGALRRRVAWGALAIVIAGLAVLLASGARVYLLGRVPAPKPAAVLQERARDLMKAFGYTETGADHAWGFQHNHDYLRWARERIGVGDPWRDLGNARVPAVQFWYRQAPRYMRPWSPDTGGRVLFGDPPRIESGMATVSLDGQGRLIAFEMVPPQIDSTGAGANTSIDWRPLFEAAGLDLARFTPTASVWVPPVECDVRAAWTGTTADLPDVARRVEAGAFGGRVNSFAVYGPWSSPNRMTPPPPSRRERAGQAVNATLLFALIIGSAFAARRHLAAGHGDRRGAIRLALAILCLNMVSWALVANHSPSVTEEWDTMVLSLGLALFLAGLVWVLYLALEPYVRRQSPDSLISWNRLLAGRGRDPRVGRDVLLGLAAGALSALLSVLYRVVASALGQPLQPDTVTLESLRGARATLALLADLHVSAIISPMALLFLIVSLRFVVRRQWIAAAILCVLFAILGGSAGGPTWLRIVFNAAVLGLQLGMLVRFGLLAGIATNLVMVVMGNYFPAVTDWSLWYAPMASAGLAYLLVLSVYAFWTSLAGQPLAGRRQPAREPAAGVALR